MTRRYIARRPSQRDTVLIHLNEAHNRTARWATALINAIELDHCNVENLHVIAWLRRFSTNKNHTETLKGGLSNPTIRELGHIANTLMRLPSTIIQLTDLINTPTNLQRKLNPDTLLGACITVSVEQKNKRSAWPILRSFISHPDPTLAHFISACHEQMYDPVEIMSSSEKIHGAWV